MISSRIQHLAMRFWEEAKAEEPFPRELESSILAAKPCLSITTLPRLCPSAIAGWLEQRGYVVGFDAAHRWLHGCFYAAKDAGFIFLDSSLSAAWRRLTLGHELA